MSTQNVTGQFLHGIEIDGKAHTEFEIRPSTAGDLFDAEALIPMKQEMGFQAALASRQLVRVGELRAHIQFDRIRKLHPADLRILFDKQEEVEALGKSAPSG